MGWRQGKATQLISYGNAQYCHCTMAQRKVEKVGATATLITNGFNFKEFTLNNPIEKRNRYEIVMLNHELEHKRCVDAWAALDIVKQNIHNYTLACLAYSILQ